MSAAIATMTKDSKFPVLTAVDDADDDSSCGHSEEGGQNNSDSELKDSGIDCSADATSDVPDEETSSMILKMVEFYLSDENILKDPFLLKHVRRNKEGYVSLKLLASFRKVRSLSRSWKAVAHSVEKSQALALNGDGTKVKRLTPLPDREETVPSRMIIAHGFESDKPSAESVSEIFSKCGDIALVRILRPGGAIPSDVKRLVAKHPEIQSHICALVEFEDYASAKKAADMVTRGFKVLVVNERNNKPESPKKDSPVAKVGPKKDSPVAKESPKKKKKARRSSKSSEGDINLLSEGQKRTRRSSSGSVSSQSSGYLSSSPSNASFFDSRFPRRHSFNPSTNYHDPNSSFASLSNRNFGSRDRFQKEKPDTESSGTLSPWRRRREQQQMMMSDSNLASSTSSTATFTMSLPVKTIRMPRGPDGTKGFCPRPRSRLPSTAE